MYPVLFAICVLVWLWAAAMRHAVLSLAGTASPMQQRVYLAMAMMAGAALLVVAVSYAMPASVLSAGWSQEQLEHLTKLSVGAVTLTALAAMWRAHLLLTGQPAVSASPAHKKKRS